MEGRLGEWFEGLKTIGPSIGDSFSNLLRIPFD